MKAGIAVASAASSCFSGSRLSGSLFLVFAWVLELLPAFVPGQRLYSYENASIVSNLRPTSRRSIRAHGKKSSLQIFPRKRQTSLNAQFRIAITRRPDADNRATDDRCMARWSIVERADQLPLVEPGWDALPPDPTVTTAYGYNRFRAGRCIVVGKLLFALGRAPQETSIAFSFPALPGLVFSP